MANPCSVTFTNISTDGTNIFVELTVFDGLHTSPTLRPVFPVGTTAASIQAYGQAIANNQPSLASDIGALVNTTLAGA